MVKGAYAIKALEEYIDELLARLEAMADADCSNCCILGAQILELEKIIEELRNRKIETTPTRPIQALPGFASHTPHDGHTPIPDDPGTPGSALRLYHMPV